MSEPTEVKKTQSLTPQIMTVNHAHILQRYVSDTGKILPRKDTGVSSKQQRIITRTIKQARNLLMIK
jgi:small subunit ribosomal protein S18